MTPNREVSCKVAATTVRAIPIGYFALSHLAGIMQPCEISSLQERSFSSNDICFSRLGEAKGCCTNTFVINSFGD